MTDQENINCVDLKDHIQGMLLREYKGLSAQEERRKRLDKLATGDTPAARIWQAALKRRIPVSQQ